MLINVIFRALDYDDLPSHKYEFMVYAIDGGSPPLTGSATVQVGVIYAFFSTGRGHLCSFFYSLTFKNMRLEIFDIREWKGVEILIGDY